MSVDITVNETVNDVEIVVQPNVIEVNVTRTSGGGGGAVNSVNGQTGTVVLNADNIAETTTRGWLTSTLKTAYDSAVTWISTNGTNLLNHLSNTSNPHITTATQVGAYTTTQVDELLALKANLFYMYKVPTTSYVTGTTVETQVLKLEINPNTFSAVDILKVHRLMFEKVGTAGGFTARVKISTSSTMPSGTTGQIAIIGLTGATTLWQSLSRNFYIDSGVLKGFPFTQATSVDNSNTTTAVSSVAFDRTVTQYLYVSITLANSADQVRLGGGLVSNI